MEQVSINKNMKLSQHFSLGELTKSNHPEVYNIPSHTAIENLKRICENWLEDLRYSYNMLYVHTGVRHTGVRPQSKVDAGVGSGPKVKSQATVLWRQTRGLRVPLWCQTRGPRLRSRLLLIRGIGRRR